MKACPNISRTLEGRTDVPLFPAADAPRRSASGPPRVQRGRIAQINPKHLFGS